MAPHADILDDRESLRNPFLASILFHVGVFAILIGWTTYSNVNKIVLGAQTPAFGNTVSVDSVRALPLPQHRGHVNPVANDTENQVPQHEIQKPQPKTRQPEPKDAVRLPSRVPEKPENKNYALQKYRSQPLRENQITGSQAPALVAPMVQKAGTSAGVGINPNSLLGTMFGGYAQALMEAVARHWNTGGLIGVQAPMAIVNVDIMRNGTIRNPQLAQHSGNSTLDYSALRAVTDAAPFPPLPPEYSGSYLNIDFRFQLQR
jgi:TonB family protein